MTDYHIAEQAQAARLAEFAATTDPADVSREIALCRLMLEDAHAKGNTGLAATLLGTINRLSDGYAKQQARTHMMLHRDALVRLANKWVGILASELQSLPDYQEIVDRVQLQFLSAVNDAQNTKSEVVKMIGREH